MLTYKIGDVLPLKNVKSMNLRRGEVVPARVRTAQRYEVKILEVGESMYRVYLPSGEGEWVPEAWLEPIQPGMWYRCMRPCRWSGWLSPWATACPRCEDPLMWEVFHEDIRTNNPHSRHLFINNNRWWRFRNVQPDHLLVLNKEPRKVVSILEAFKDEKRVVVCYW